LIQSSSRQRRRKTRKLPGLRASAIGRKISEHRVKATTAIPSGLVD